MEKQEDKLKTISAEDRKHEEIDFSSLEHSLLTCPKCNHFIGADDIHLDKTTATCGHCGHEFRFLHDSKSGQLATAPLLPEGVETLKLRSELDIRLDWHKTVSRGGRKFMTLFAVLWNLMLLPFVILALATGKLGILLFISLHLAVGMSMLYYIAAVHFNKSSLQLNRRRLKVESSPFRLPSFPAREIEINDIDQLYVSRYTASTTNGVPDYAYALYAVTKNGNTVSLLRGMNYETQRYIEQEIEGYLGITNRRITGEAGS